MARRLQVGAHVPEERPIAILMGPFAEFVAARASGGIVLLVAALVALVWANSPWWPLYQRLQDFHIEIGWSDHAVSHSLHYWINDGLMTIFFLLVGLEIKRELLVGELSAPRKAALPIAAALGGVIFPALIYAALNFGGAGQRGWGIPMATDIAFAVGAIALLGSRVPGPLGVFLTALAIVDDLVAVVVIAVFYTDEIHFIPFALAGFVFAFLILLNRLGVAQPIAYAIPGVLLWAAVLQSGVHATISGVLLAITIPSRRFFNPKEFLDRSRKLLGEFEQTIQEGEEREEAIEALESASQHVEPPLHRIERALAPWVSLGIMPLFAFVNAGVRIVNHPWTAYVNPVTAGVLLGLLFGKPAGIILFSWITSRLGLSALPDQVRWKHIHGASWLAGIGFTMSLFVGGLAFGQTELLDLAKVGILAGSTVAGITGSFLLLRATRNNQDA
jgi:NhaA family Na+:H+ antiporter